MIKTKISAEIIADSKNEFGNRITTFVLKFPRIILAEFNTHRMLSRNSASSRAIPFKKMMDLVLQDPFIPIAWMKDHSGMQGQEFFNEKESEKLTKIWMQSSIEAVTRAQDLSSIGLSKQICNRLLEPFMYHTVICTGTEWENFFALRAHGAAEIHMQELANRMLEAYNNSDPKLLKAGEWHIPFGDKFDIDRLNSEIKENQSPTNLTIEDYKIKIATARCGRVSYLNFEGKDDYAADIKLHDGLLIAGHMSPFEHCAQAMDKNTANYYPGDDTFIGTEFSGNFRGFTQYRKMLDGENKTDNRIKK